MSGTLDSRTGGLRVVLPLSSPILANYVRLQVTLIPPPPRDPY